MQQLPTDPNELVDENFLADYYEQSTRTIKLWRYQGRGPGYVRLSATQIRYRWGDVLEHNAKHSAISTSEESARECEA